MLRRISCFLFIAMLAASVVSAQSKDETAVATAVETLRKAMVDGDKAVLEKIAAADLSYGHSSGVIENKSQFVEALASGKSDFTSINLSNQTIKIVGNTALVRHLLEGETNDNGNRGKVRLFILLVWQKQKGDWLLLARQAARAPQQ